MDFLSLVLQMLTKIHIEVFKRDILFAQCYFDWSDLVVGAYESQTVFVLRSIPVAVADITITAPSDPIRLDDYNCRDPNDNPITW